MKTPTTYTLRRSSVDDAALFYNVVDRTMREFIIKTWDRWDESRVRRESAEKSRDPNAQIVRVSDMSVGVFVVERHPTHIQLAQIYLLPEYQREGIGTALLKALIAEASHSKMPVRLDVMAVNPAKSFYERLGFSVTEATSEFFYMEKLP
jgi:ribosomal protein S18 acetylase RimI-like enzyme